MRQPFAAVVGASAPVHSVVTTAQWPQEDDRSLVVVQSFVCGTTPLVTHIRPGSNWRNAMVFLFFRCHDFFVTGGGATGMRPYMRIESTRYYGANSRFCHMPLPMAFVPMVPATGSILFLTMGSLFFRNHPYSSEPWIYTGAKQTVTLVMILLVPVCDNSSSTHL